MTAAPNDDDLRRARLLVQPEDLRARLSDPATVVLDAQVDLPAPRFDGDHRVQSGHDGWLAARIPGSRHADLVDALSAPHPSLTFVRPDPRDFVQALASLGVGRGARVAVYDRSDGFWAARLWWMLRWIGFEAAVLDGGWNAWVAAGLPQEQGTAAPFPVVEPVEPDPRDALWVDRAEIEQALRADDPPQLICALAEAQFSGHTPTRYARRGHIPGSANIPARTLFDATGRYLPASQLRAAFAALDPERPAWLYCGGGISAAVDALALTLIGRHDVRLYDGSLQEWAADAALPLETSE